MSLDLIDGRLDLRRLPQVLDLLLCEVRDADASHFSLFNQIFKGFPGLADWDIDDSNFLGDGVNGKASGVVSLLECDRPVDLSMRSAVCKCKLCAGNHIIPGINPRSRSADLPM